jgi:hypothetical protein
MPILMKHSGNAAPVLAGEFGTGLEKRSWEGMNAELAQQRQHENIDFGYSAQQRAEFNKLAEAGAQAATSGLFTPDELTDVQREIMTKQAGIQPMPRMTKTSAYPPDRGIGKSWTSDDGAVVMTRDEKGQEKVLYKTEAAPTVKDIADLYKQAQVALTKTVGTDTVTPQPEEVEAYVTNAVRLHQKLRGMATGKNPQTITPEAALGGDQPAEGDQTDSNGMFGVPGVGVSAASANEASAPAGLPEAAAPAVDANTAKIIATLPPEQAKIVSALVPKNLEQATNQDRMLKIINETRAEHPKWSPDRIRLQVKARMASEFGVKDL